MSRLPSSSTPRTSEKPETKHQHLRRLFAVVALGVPIAGVLVFEVIFAFANFYRAEATRPS